jgi:hypothetical protein
MEVMDQVAFGPAFCRKLLLSGPDAAMAASRFTALELKIERLDQRMARAQWMLAVLIGGMATLIIKALA